MQKPEESSARSRKLSEVIAAKLMDEIRRRGWPVGESLGTEAELMARFEVSRATVAEAVRQVERYGAATMRRGSGGGLVVTNSARSALSRAISTYLELSNVSVIEQYEATRLIETESVKLAAVYASEEQIAALRVAAARVAASDDNLGLHRSAMQLRLAIAEASSTHPVLLFTRSLARVITHYIRPDLRTQYRDREFEHGMVADLSGIVEAIAAGDSELAAYYVKLDVARREQRARELAVAQPLLEGGPLRRETPNKLAEKVAYAIRDDIARAGWQVGEKLGDEADLPQRYGVSQWVLRQAIRILEPSGIVQVRRGQGGGLYIGRPSSEHTIEMAVSYLNAYQESSGQMLNGFLKIRRCVYQGMAQFAANRSTVTEREELCSFAAEGSLKSKPFWALLAVMGRNQVLRLFGEIMDGFIAANDSEKNVAHTTSEFVSVAAAIRDGDAPLARRRMGKLLDY